jgi:hypothetical protein
MPSSTALQADKIPVTVLTGYLGAGGELARRVGTNFRK